MIPGAKNLQPTRAVGRATKDALRLGDRLTFWGSRDHARRVKETLRFAAVLEGNETC